MMKFFSGKRLFLRVSLLVLFVAPGRSDEVLRRNDGQVIILHEDFSWEFARTEAEGMITLQAGKELTERLTSKTGKFSLYCDPGNWTATEGLNAQAEFQFINAGNTGFSMLLFDGLSISPEQMRDVILLNARRADKNAYISRTDQVLVNGKPGTIFTYAAQVESLRFIFYSLVMNNKKGTIQYVFYTLDSAFEELKPMFQRAMAGLFF